MDDAKTLPGLLNFPSGNAYGSAGECLLSYHLGQGRQDAY